MPPRIPNCIATASPGLLSAPKKAIPGLWIGPQIVQGPIQSTRGVIEPFVSDTQNTAAKDGPEASRRVTSDGDQFRVSFRRMGRRTGSGSLAMTCKRMTRQGATFLLVVGFLVGISQAQTTPGSSLGNRPAPYGSFSPGYPPANYFNRMRRCAWKIVNHVGSRTGLQDSGRKIWRNLVGGCSRETG